MNQQTEAMKLALEALESCHTGHTTGGSHQWYDKRLVDKAVTALDEALAQPQQEPVECANGCRGFFKHHPPARKPLTAREIELLDGMIEVQLDHAARCDNMANRVMAEKQKGWDMERVELLRKLKGDA